MSCGLTSCRLIEPRSLAFGRAASARIFRLRQPVPVFREVKDVVEPEMFDAILRGMPQRLQNSFLNQLRDIMLLKAQESGRLFTTKPGREATNCKNRMFEFLHLPPERRNARY